jgi:hypothetical protein
MMCNQDSDARALLVAFETLRITGWGVKTPIEAFGT